MLLKFVLFSLMFVGTGAWAQNLHVDSQPVTNYLSASIMTSHLSVPGGGITGNGLQIDFAHYFNPKLSFDFALASALNSKSASFTGLNGYFYYTVLGDFGDVNNSVTLDQTAILVEKNHSKSSLQLGIGVDQFFLNGSQAVYSVSGIGVGAKYNFILWNQDLNAAFRYSMMSAGSTSIQGMFLTIGITFPL